MRQTGGRITRNMDRRTVEQVNRQEDWKWMETDKGCKIRGQIHRLLDLGVMSYKGSNMLLPAVEDVDSSFHLLQRLMDGDCLHPFIALVAQLLHL